MVTRRSQFEQFAGWNFVLLSLDFIGSTTQQTERFAE
jgi:hypothetical protein